MDKVLVVIFIVLSLSHTTANPAGSRYTGSSKKSEPHSAPFDDEDGNPFSGEYGMSLSYSTFGDEIGKFDMKQSNIVEDFDQDDKRPLGLLQQSYDADFYGDYGDGSDECEFLKTLGIHCDTGDDYEPPTEEEAEGDEEEEQTTSDTVVATLTVITDEPSVPFEDHTSTTSSAVITTTTTSTEEPITPTPTKTKQALATTTTTTTTTTMPSNPTIVASTIQIPMTESAVMITTKNQKETDKNQIEDNNPTPPIAITIRSTPIGIGPTISENTNKTWGLPSDSTEDEYQAVVIPELIPVNSATTRVAESRVSTNTAESTSTSEYNVVAEVDTPAEAGSPVRSIQNSSSPTTIGDIGTVRATDKSGSITNLAENVNTSEGNELEITKPATSSTVSTTKSPKKAASDSVSSSGEDTITTVDALKTTAGKPDASKTVTPKDDAMPQTQGPTNKTPQPTTGTKTATETSTSKTLQLTTGAKTATEASTNKTPQPTTGAKTAMEASTNKTPQPTTGTKTATDASTNKPPQPTTGTKTPTEVSTNKTPQPATGTKAATEASTNKTPQLTTGTKTARDASSVVDKTVQLTETAKTDQQDDDARQPFTTPVSDKANEDVKTDSIAPQKAKFSTIILIVCIVSLLIVLILVIAIILIVRARLKRRGKYAITSEIETTEGAPEGQAGKSDVAQGGGEKVVTVQYNDSNT